MGLITLTTDFGTADWFVGAMKGVMLRVSGRNRIVDITHDIPSGDIASGAFALASCYKYYPPQTIHVAVVDPGVGSERPAIAVKTENFAFIGPDNGLLSLALETETIQQIHRIENEELFCQPVSRTFHGRDIFAPVAAHLGRGLEFSKIGPPQEKYTRLPWPSIGRRGNDIVGEVIHIDRFGNAITNIAESMAPSDIALSRVTLPDGKLIPLKRFYQEVADGEPLALVGSCGYMEISINRGNAAEVFGLSVGSPVLVSE